MEPRNGYEDGNYESKNGSRAITRLPENEGDRQAQLQAEGMLG